MDFFVHIDLTSLSRYLYTTFNNSDYNDNTRTKMYAFDAKTIKSRITLLFKHTYYPNEILLLFNYLF